MIDLWAHPNQQGVLTSMNLSETEEQTTCQVGLLAPKFTIVLLALKTAVETAIEMFKFFHLIFLEGFKIMGLDEKIEVLIGELNRVFKAYLPQFDEAARREFLKPY